VPAEYHTKPPNRKLQVAGTLATVLAVVTGIWAVLGQPEPQQQPESSAASSTMTALAPSAIALAPTSFLAPPPPPPPPLPPPPPPPIEEVAFQLCPTVLRGAQPHVAQVGNFIKGLFGIKDVGGASGRGGSDDHTRGLALDFMVNDVAVGSALASYVLGNQSMFGVSYVIWQQRYNDGKGWSKMEDRGSRTANHYDHVHVSFAPGGRLDLTC